MTWKRHWLGFSETTQWKYKKLHIMRLLGYAKSMSMKGNSLLVHHDWDLHLLVPFAPQRGLLGRYFHKVWKWSQELCTHNSRVLNLSKPGEIDEGTLGLLFLLVHFVPFSTRQLHFYSAPFINVTHIDISLLIHFNLFLVKSPQFTLFLCCKQVDFLV
jgi:hypothetical protein